MRTPDELANLRVESGASYLAVAWQRYKNLFGVEPHGTEKQMAALLELAQPEKWVTATNGREFVEAMEFHNKKAVVEIHANKLTSHLYVKLRK